MAAPFPFTSDLRLKTEHGVVTLIWAEGTDWSLERETDSFASGFFNDGSLYEKLFFQYYPDKNDPETYDMMIYERDGAGPRYTFLLNDALRGNEDSPGATPFFVTTGWDVGPFSAGDGEIHGVAALTPITFDGVVYTFDPTSNTNFLSPGFEGEFFGEDDNAKPLPMLVVQDQRHADLSGSIPAEATAYLDYFPNAAVASDEAWVLEGDVWVPFAINEGSGGVAGGTNHTFSFPHVTDVPAYAPPQYRPFTEFDDAADQAALSRDKGFKAEEGFTPANGFRRRNGFTRANGF